MAEELTPQVFRKSPEATISYNFTDVLRGTSYLKLYCSAIYPKATVYESYATGTDSESKDTATKWTAQTFTIGTTGTNEDFYAIGAEIKCVSGGGVEEDYVVQIEGVTAGKPNGTILARAYLDNYLGCGDVNYNWTKFTFDRFPRLSASTKYALVVYRLGSSNAFIVKYNNAGNYTGGEKYDTINSGVDWTEDAGADLVFRILGTTTSPLTFFPEDLDSSPSPVFIDVDATSTDYVNVFDQDIDIILGYRASINGDIILSVPITVSTAEQWINFYYTAEIFKVVSGVETSIGTAESNAINFDTGTTAVTQTFLMKCNINDLIHFKKGDILRLNLKFYSKSETTGTSDITLNWKDIWMNLPFKIDN